ncbi:MAG: hypothetical protein Ct9H90mP2_02680 [Dehalococcoidia bacterium]|nr:MAG: hypothetical protein Ct9H90mP2_02680 [Dehalococcoidia bacterium]
MPNIADCWDRKTATFMILGIHALELAHIASKDRWPGFVDKSKPSECYDN